MDFKAKFERVDVDDPNRCQYIRPTHGQCDNKACDGSTYCPAHGGNRGAQTKQKKKLRNYRLNKYKNRIAKKSNSSDILSLKDEIGILRLLIEEKINRCTNGNDIIMMSGPLSDLIMKVERMVSSCTKLESRLGNFLDKNSIIQFAQTIVKIIAENITDETVLETISDQILEVLDV